MYCDAIALQVISSHAKRFFFFFHVQLEEIKQYPVAIKKMPKFLVSGSLDRGIESATEPFGQKSNHKQSVDDDVS